VVTARPVLAAPPPAPPAEVVREAARPAPAPARALAPAPAAARPPPLPPRRADRAERAERPAAKGGGFQALDEDTYDIPAFLRRGGHGVPE